MPFSRGYSQPRDQTHISCSSCISVRFLTAEAVGKPRKIVMLESKPEMLLEVSILPLQLFRNGRGTRDQITNIRWIIEKQKSSGKTSASTLLTMYVKTSDCVDHKKLENSERDRNTRPSDLPPEKSVCRSRSNS